MHPLYCIIASCVEAPARGTAPGPTRSSSPVRPPATAATASPAPRRPHGQPGCAAAARGAARRPTPWWSRRSGSPRALNRVEQPRAAPAVSRGNGLGDGVPSSSTASQRHLAGPGSPSSAGAVRSPWSPSQSFRTRLPAQSVRPCRHTLAAARTAVARVARAPGRAISKPGLASRRLE